MDRRTAFCSLLMVLVAASLCVSHARAQQRPAFSGCKLDRRGKCYAPNRILVKFKETAPSQTAEALIRRQKGTIRSEIPRIAVKIIELPADEDEQIGATALSSDPNVEYAELDYMFAASLPNDPLYADPATPQWHLPKIAAPTAWNTTTGDPNLIIAVLDDGVSLTHPDLAGKIWVNPGEIPANGVDDDGDGYIDNVNGWNFSTNDADVSSAAVQGTKAAGVAAAQGNNGIGVASPAWGVKIMPVVAVKGGWAYSSTAAQGIVYAADHGARLATMSWGLYPSIVLSQAANYMAEKKGLVFATPPGQNFWPEVETSMMLWVSATDRYDRRAATSGLGNYIALSAPGSEIMTTSGSDSYTKWLSSGSASAVAAGAAALVISAKPSLTAAEVKDILIGSADDLGPNGWDIDFGFGRINAGRAVQIAAGKTGPLPDTTSPAVVITSPAAPQNVSGSLAVKVSASDNTAVSSVTLTATKLGAMSQLAFTATGNSVPYNFSLNTTSFSSGTYRLEAVAADAAGNVGKAVRYVYFDNGTPDLAAPVVTIQPNSAARGVYNVRISATDDGGLNNLAFASLSVDGAFVGTDTDSIYSVPWDARFVPNGIHTLTASVTDAAGNVGTTETTVNVQNPTILSSDPPSGYVDAREDRDASDSSSLFGTQDISLTFSEPLIAPSGGPLTADNFKLTYFRGGTRVATDAADLATQTAPMVTLASGSGAGPYILRFAPRIPLGAWTQIEVINALDSRLQHPLATFNGANKPVFGFLPMDTTQDGRVLGDDISRWLAVRNGSFDPSPLTLENICDQKRNGVLVGEDVNRAVQLITGANGTTFRAWSNFDIGAKP